MQQSQRSESATNNSGSPTVDGRHGFVDALRGFALLGILVVNIEFIVQPSEIGWLNYDSPLDEIVRWLITAFGQTKVYPLFALLFGYGLSLQLKKARASDIALGPRYRRRMIGIALLGVGHGVLFFPGDILVIYAAIGAAAFALRNTDTRTLLRTATVVYVVATVVWVMLGVLDAVNGASPPTASADAVEVLADGSFVEVIVVHFFYWLVTLAILAAVQGPAVLAFFLVGIALGRTDWLAAPAQHRHIAESVLRWMPLGLVGGAIGATLTIIGGRWDTLGFAIGFAAAPVLAAGYLAGLGLLLGRKSGLLSRTLEASGRMSLTIYLLESVVATTLAYGYGFGLFGDVAPLGGLLLAIAIWLGLSGFAVVWMRHARFGPFEWALRSFTYRRLQRMSKG